MVERRRHWFVTGASGLFGQYFCKHLRAIGDDVTGIAHAHAVTIDGVHETYVDLLDLDGVVRPIESINPTTIVHAAGLTNVDLCEDREGLAYSLHALATERLALIAENRGIEFVYISTDHLWDGTRPFVNEETTPQPMNAYARTKYAGERMAFSSHRSPLIIRTNFFGKGLPWRRSFSDWIMEALSARTELAAFSDVYFTPISLPFLCATIAKVVSAGGKGIFHIAGRDRISKFDFARGFAKTAGIGCSLIRETSFHDANLKAPRPGEMSLATEKITSFMGAAMPSCGDSIRSVFGCKGGYSC